MLRFSMARKVRCVGLCMGLILRFFFDPISRAQLTGAASGSRTIGFDRELRRVQAPVERCRLSPEGRGDRRLGGKKGLEAHRAEHGTVDVERVTGG
jgi:hypothetical protein